MATGVSPVGTSTTLAASSVRAGIVVSVALGVAVLGVVVLGAVVREGSVAVVVDDATSTVEVVVANWPSDEQEVSARPTPMRADTIAFFMSQI